MRRLPLAVTSTLLVLACGDDGPTEDPSESSSSGEADSTSTGPILTSTTVEPTGSTTDVTTDATTTGLDSTTAPAVECGNGIVEEGEECDDENVEDDDDCSSICTIPFAELWTVTYDGGDADSANHALFDAEGNVYVLGSTQVTGQGRDLWLRQYTAEGREGWTWTYNGVFGDDDIGRRMAWLDGDIVIVGSETTELTGEDVLVLRLATADQTVVWSQTIAGASSDPTDNDDFGTSITVDADGNVLVAAAMRVDMQEYDMALRKLDPDGNELWLHEYDNPDFHGSDVPDVVLADPNGDIYLAGDTEISAFENDGWVRKLDTDGNEQWTETIAVVGLSNGALDPDGNVVLVGLDNPTNLNIWVAKYDPDFTQLGTDQHDGPSGSFDVGFGVAVGASSDIYVSGYVTVVGEQSNTWVGRWASDLDLRLWSDSYSNTDSNLADEARGIAVSEDESRVVAVGFESVIGEDTNIWVRMYQNNPAP